MNIVVYIYIYIQLCSIAGAPRRRRRPDGAPDAPEGTPVVVVISSIVVVVVVAAAAAVVVVVIVVIVVIVIVTTELVIVKLCYGQPAHHKFPKLIQISSGFLTAWSLKFPFQMPSLELVDLLHIGVHQTPVQMST